VTTVTTTKTMNAAPRQRSGVRIFCSIEEQVQDHEFKLISRQAQARPIMHIV
jgi:hypothetical protein